MRSIWIWLFGFALLALAAVADLAARFWLHLGPAASAMIGVGAVIILVVLLLALAIWAVWDEDETYYRDDGW